MVDSEEYLRQTSPTTMTMASTIASYLRGWNRYAVVPIVNMHTIFLKLPKGTYPNSNLLVAGAGHGKGALMTGILWPSNPDILIKLGDKSFESKLVKRPSPDFKDKVWVGEDLIVILEGMSQKQRAQWSGFFVQLLATGQYDRDDDTHTAPITDAFMSCMFGIASERWKDFKGPFLGMTLLERIIPIYLAPDPQVDIDMMCATIDRRHGGEFARPPRLALRRPLNNEKIKIAVPESVHYEIVDIAGRLLKYTGLSAARATNYVLNFLSANAYLNGRTEITVADLYLWQHVEDLHYPENGSNVNKVRAFLRKATEEVSADDIVAGIPELGIKAVRNALDELVDTREIEVRTAAHNKRYYRYPRHSGPEVPESPCFDNSSLDIHIHNRGNLALLGSSLPVDAGIESEKSPAKLEKLARPTTKEA